MVEKVTKASPELIEKARLYIIGLKEQFGSPVVVNNEEKEVKQGRSL